MAEPIPFLPPFFPPPEIFSFWEISIAITPFGTQMVLLMQVRRKYSIESSLLTSSPSMIVTYPLSSIAPLAVAPPQISVLLLHVSPILATGRCLRTWVHITYQFFYLLLSLRSFALTSVSFHQLLESSLG